MPTKIFISASPQDEFEREWAIEFQRAVARVAGCVESEVYLYTEQRLARDIPKEVREHITQANRMICLISDDYLRSGWCALEHLLFYKKSPGAAENCIGVYQPFLKDWIETNEGAKERRVDDGIKRIQENRYVSWTLELSAHLSGPWRRWLLHARHIDFHALKTWPRALSDENAAHLRQVADPITASDSLLRRSAALSAYALAADRYHDGGWGFSLGHSFDFDDYDGHELARGRYDIGVVALCTLALFLDSDVMIAEWEAVFGSGEEERQPRIRVGDRQPLLAGLLACLGSSGRLGPDIRNAPLGKILSILEKNLGDNRWTLTGRPDGAEKSDYGAMLWVCLNQLDSAAKAIVGPARHRLEEERTKGLIETYVAVAEGDVSRALKKRNLFAAALRRAADTLAGKRPDAAAIREDQHTAALWLLLTLSEDSAGQLERELERTGSRVWSKAEFEPLFASFARLAAIEEPDDHAVTLMISCAAVLAADGVEIPSRLHEVQGIVAKLLEREDLLHRILNLNAIGWTSFILFAYRTASRAIDNSLLEFMWSSGRELRRQRNDAVDSAKVADAIRVAIEERVRNCATAAYTRLVAVEEGLLDADSSSDVNLETFLEQLNSSSFWGLRVTVDANSEATSQSGAFLAGVLRVRASTKQVDLETPGYNQMFLHPFSRITGINVLNLRSLRREFGDQDAKLVQLMGETVVVSCYERFGDEFIPSSRTFEERTQFISDQLTSLDWDATKGFDDLLVVKKGPEGERWVYRTALIQRGPGGPQNAFDDQVISWRFVEMPPTVKSLVRDSKRLEKLSNDRRPSA